MLIVGLTGGIGSGKSTVARYFAEMGAPIIDADEIAKELVVPGSPALNEIVAEFGPGVLRSDGALDRATLRDLVFADADRRRALESIMHPRIYDEMRRRIAELAAPYCILVIPLLLETGQQDFVDRVLVIDTPENLQYERVQHRDGLAEAVIAAILQAQLDRTRRLNLADDVITNDGDLMALRRQTQELARVYRQMGAREASS